MFKVMSKSYQKTNLVDQVKQIEVITILSGTALGTEGISQINS